ncbi:MAG: hypothetical protein AB7F86_15115 [Bdellovibrionales bacterium]
MKMLIFLLPFLTFLSPAWSESSSIVIRFVSFTGQNCGYVHSQAGWFIDRWSDSLSRGDIPWEKLLGRDIERRAFVVPTAEIPDENSIWSLYFRFYALHSSTSADHYESDFHLTKEFANTLQPGEVKTMALTTQPTYRPEQGRQCTLTLQFVGL